MLLPKCDTSHFLYSAQLGEVNLKHINKNHPLICPGITPFPFCHKVSKHKSHAVRQDKNQNAGKSQCYSIPSSPAPSLHPPRFCTPQMLTSSVHSRKSHPPSDNHKISSPTYPKSESAQLPAPHSCNCTNQSNTEMVKYKDTESGYRKRNCDVRKRWKVVGSDKKSKSSATGGR